MSKISGIFLITKTPHLQSTLFIWQSNLDFAVQPARAKQRRIQLQIECKNGWKSNYPIQLFVISSFSMPKSISNKFR